MSFALTRLVGRLVNANLANAEVYVASAFYYAATVAYLAYFVPLLLAIPLAAFVIQLPMSVSGAIILRDRNNLRWHSLLMMTLLFAASAYMATRGSWIAWPVLALFAANALAAVVMRCVD